MDKRETTILVWILSLSLLLVIILYSPLGSPDMYHTNYSYFAVNNVSFNGRIQNSSNNSSFGASSSPELLKGSYKINDPTVEEPASLASEKMIEINDPTKNTVSYTNTATKKVKSYTVASGGSSISERGTSYSVSVSSTATNFENQTAGGGSGGAAIPAFSYNSTNKETENNRVNADFAVTNLDLSIFSDSTANKRAVDYQQNQGGTDPGGNPNTDPIPVSDGVWYMFGLLIVYLLFKKMFSKKLIKNSLNNC